MKNIVFDAIDSILKNNQNKLQIPLQQKAKFERWLQIELAAELYKLDPSTTIEYPYPKKRKTRADISSHGYLIELKTPNTNFKISNISSKPKPLSKNIKSAVEDIARLQRYDGKGMVAFVFFPVVDPSQLNIATIKNRLSNAQNIKDGISCKYFYIFVAEV